MAVWPYTLRSAIVRRASGAPRDHADPWAMPTVPTGLPTLPAATATAGPAGTGPGGSIPPRRSGRLRIVIAAGVRVWWLPELPSSSSSSSSSSRHLQLVAGPPAAPSVVEVTVLFPPRTRDLLHVLADHPRGAHPDTVAAALWPDTPTALIGVRCTVALSLLRRAVAVATHGALAGVVQTGPDGSYRLDPNRVDIHHGRPEVAADAPTLTWLPIRDRASGPDGPTAIDWLLGTVATARVLGVTGAGAPGVLGAFADQVARGRGARLVILGQLAARLGWDPAVLTAGGAAWVAQSAQLPADPGLVVLADAADPSLAVPPPPALPAVGGRAGPDRSGGSAPMWLLLGESPTGVTIHVNGEGLIVAAAPAQRRDLIGITLPTLAPTTVTGAVEPATPAMPAAPIIPVAPVMSVVPVVSVGAAGARAAPSPMAPQQRPGDHVQAAASPVGIETAPPRPAPDPGASGSPGRVDSPDPADGDPPGSPDPPADPGDAAIPGEPPASPPPAASVAPPGAVRPDRPQWRLTVLGRPTLHGPDRTGSDPTADSDINANARRSRAGVAPGPEAATVGLSPRMLDLVVFLALHPEGVRRDAVVAALWPDTGRRRPANNLSSLISRLRSSLRATAHPADAADGDHGVLVEGERCRLDPSRWTVDYWDFLAATSVGSGPPAQRLDADELRMLHAAHAAYRGLLGEGIDHAWILSVREATRRRFLGLTARLVRHHAATDPALALAVLEVARNLDPTNQSLYRDIIALQLRLGDNDAAAATLRLLQSQLADVEETVDPATTQLASRITNGHTDPMT